MNFAFQFLDFSTSQLSFVFYTFHLYFIHLCFIRDKFDSGEINTAFQVGSSKEPHYRSFCKNNNFFGNEALKEFNPFFFLQS